jgi:diketogulonate reductase-like aldo/keto reductase
MKVPSLKLADKHEIPQVALGLWKNKDAGEFATAFEAAIAAGYRHFDSAQAYDNEQFLGEAWKKSGLKREELFITTKIAVPHFGHRRAKQTFAESLEKLQTNYVNLLLLHFPVPVLRQKSWQALEEIRAAGGAKSIGVSNYTIRHLEEMKDYAKVMPVVNQVELHVFLQQPELVKYCQDNNILVEAYSPLAHAKATDNQVVSDIAKKHGKTYAQIMLRWLVEQDLVVLPKSVTPSRIQENIDIFDFKLDDADRQALAAQDQDLRTCWSPVHVP